MTPDELVDANPRNLAIRYSDIASAEVKRRFFQWQLGFHLSGPSTTERTVSFNLSKKQVTEAQRLLKLIPLPENS